MICFILLLNQSWILKKKHLPYLAGIIIVASAVVYYVSRMPKTGLLYVIRLEEPLTLAPVWVFNGFYQSVIPAIPLVLSVFLYAFILGVLVFAFTFYIYLPKLKSMQRNNEGYDEDLDFKSDIFNFLLICATLGFFIVITRSATYELRWFFPMVIGMLVFTAKGILVPLDYLGTLHGVFGANRKKIAAALIIIVVCLGAFNQLAHADMIIKMKVTSYQEVKDSGLWMKQNSNPGDLILSASEPQHTYYAERKVYNLNWFGTEENFTNFINENHPKFLVLSIFESTPEWAFLFPATHNDTIIPLIGYSIDGKQTALAIYEVRAI
jgi:hypothetical protein